MKKLWLILIVLALLLTGCGEAAISCGVDQEKNAWLDLEYQCDWSDVTDDERRSLRNGFKKLVDHYEDTLGFTVELEEYTDTGCSLKVTKVCPAQTYAEAFKELEAMLSDPAMTPFVEVHTDLQQQSGIEGYGLDVTLDAGSFLDSIDVTHFPGDFQRYFRQSVENSSATLRLELPASELVYGPDGTICADGMARIETVADLSGETTISLATLALIQDGQVVEQPQEPMEEEVQRLNGEKQMLTLILCGLGLVLMVFLVLLVLNLRKTAGKKAESQAPAQEQGTAEPASPERENAPQESREDPREESDQPATQEETPATTDRENPEE